ncbi:MAG: SDR family oxidoreductase [Cryomorphaceae bacterium]
MIGNKKHYLIAGATGLVGKQLLQLLLNDPETGKVTSLVRNKTDENHSKLMEKVIDWNNLEERDIPISVDATFCCLGTTMRKAGGKAAFKLVDFDYVLKLAVFSQRAKTPQLHIISAAGANPKAIIFYNRVKGNMESELQKLRKIKSIYIYRPSMLLGDRGEFRIGETIGKILMKMVSFMTPKSSKAIYDVQVAMSMLHFAKHSKKGIHTISNAEMHDLT